MGCAKRNHSRLPPLRTRCSTASGDSSRVGVRNLIRHIIMFVSAAVAMVSVVYMIIFLLESSMEAAVITASSKQETVNDCLLEKACTNNRRPSRTTPSLHDSIALLTSRRFLCLCWLE
ncbi:hypothetical protein L2E82_19511 [Cichorium intybus]|uniref:Uncharacterized protein n=1 Tax=Cichorium intybus TaxID=13427 RepID=A0ACB9FCF0_CICIN|nr:hypothetical protein L2E82_19511 [Cichorium intybus]